MSQLNSHDSNVGHGGQAHALPAGAERDTDPVCGMTVAVGPQTPSAVLGDQTFHFCSERCQTKFGIDPWFYASVNSAKRGEVAQVGTQYT